MIGHLNLEGELCIRPELSKEDTREFEACNARSWALLNSGTLYPRSDGVGQDSLKELGFLISNFLTPGKYHVRGKLSWRSEDGRTGSVEVENNEIRLVADLEQDRNPADLTIELMASLQSVDRDLRLFALDMINQEYSLLTNKAVFLPHLLELTESRDLDLRLAAVTALGQFEEFSTQVLPALMLAMTDPNSWIRAAAAENLGDLGKAAQDALPALEELTRDRDHGPSFQAHGAIHRILIAATT